MIFNSPTKGRMTLDQVFKDIVEYIHDDSKIKYKLIVGTDSQLREDVCYVTAILILREGKGGRFYYSKEREKTKLSLKQRIFYETSKSLTVAARLAEKLTVNGLEELDIQIHLDVGEHGQTKEIIKEVVGMVVGSGFDARIKPDSYGASKVADKYTK
jgi:predicted RNase H-related nuclease YkuK (DUF458 family)